MKMERRSSVLRFWTEQVAGMVLPRLNEIAEIDSFVWMLLLPPLPSGDSVSAAPIPSQRAEQDDRMVRPVEADQDP